MPIRPTTRRLARATLWGGGCALLLTACGPDAPPPREASLQGRWTVVSATRGGRPTQTLNAAYFEFDTARRELSTNFPGEELRLAYRRDGNTLRLRGTALIDQLDISEHTDSTLAFGSVISGRVTTFELAPEPAVVTEVE